jgi:hypothetical protein
MLGAWGKGIFPGYPEALGEANMNMVRLSSWLAIAVGAILAVAQVARNLDNAERWMSWSIDVAAGLIMIAAGLLALRKQTTRLLPVGWSFALGLYAAAFLTHLTVLQKAEGNWYEAELKLVLILGGLLSATLVGLALVLFAPREQAR